MLIKYQKCCDIIKLVHDITPKKVLHIGAHTGEEALDYYNNGVKDVIWFEANDELIPKLQAHISQFPMNQQICPIALWDKNEVLKFKITNNFQSSSFFDLNTHSSHYPNIVVTEEKDVQALRLDSIISHPDNLLIFNDFEFINIDTQGAELAILKGFGHQIYSSSIKGIYLEVNKEKLYADIPLVNEIDTFLIQFNFHRIKTNWTSAGWGDAFYLKAD